MRSRLGRAASGGHRSGYPGGGAATAGPRPARRQGLRDGGRHRGRSRGHALGRRADLRRGARAAGRPGPADRGRPRRQPGGDRGRALPVRPAGGVQPGAAQRAGRSRRCWRGRAGAGRRAARRARATTATVALAKRAVPARERTFAHTIEGFVTLAAAQKNRVVATVRVARPLTAEQRERLRAALSSRSAARSPSRRSSTRTCSAGSGSSSATRSSRAPWPAARGGPPALRLDPQDSITTPKTRARKRRRWQN